MIHVVLDTNVLASSLLKPSGPNKLVIATVLTNPNYYQICVSPHLIDEYEEVLFRPLFQKNCVTQKARTLIDIIKANAVEIAPFSLGHLVYPDEKDRQFLETAVYVGGILITNNLKDFPFLGVNIMGPEEFLAFHERKFC